MFDKAKMQSKIQRLEHNLSQDQDKINCLNGKLDEAKAVDEYRVAFKPRSDYFVIPSPVSVENRITQKKAGDFKPLFFVNDTTDIHTGTIDYYNDLLRKLFDKESLSKFYQAVDKVDENSRYPVNMLDIVKKNTMHFSTARSKGLIKLSDYNTFAPRPVDCMGMNPCMPRID